MPDKEKFDIVWFLGEGIGNVLEALYSVEYCIRIGKKCGVCLENIPESFVAYLSTSYPNLIIKNIKGIHAETILHSWLFTSPINILFKNYLFINPNKESVEYASEDETYLSAVETIYPIEDRKRIDYLEGLREKKPDPELIDLDKLRSQTVIYFGCSYLSPSKRWPYFNELIKQLGHENCILVGGKEDLNFTYSYVYPKMFKYLNKLLTNRIELWKICRILSVLKPYAHFELPSDMDKSTFIQKLSWEELVFVLKRAKSYVGNDGGISHLAGASNVKKGVVLFGPSSIKKSHPFNKNIRSISRSFKCQPCLYEADGIHMGKRYINCPYQVKCLKDIKVEEVLSLMI